MPLTCSNRQDMNLDFGLADPDVCQKQKFRWMFQIEGVSGTSNALPPLKSSRPKLEFKEQQVQHLTQSIYYPIKAEWRPITLTLYDLKLNENPVFDWIKVMYDPTSTTSEWSPVYSSGCDDSECFKRNALLCVYDGCGEVIEKWKYENCYPQTVDWGELDMGNSEVITVDITLRYDRAYFEN